MDDQTLPCPDCGTSLPDTVVEALEFLYGGTVLRVDSLAGNLAWGIRERQRTRDDLSDAGLGQLAIYRWLNDMGPAALIEAARHHERLSSASSECGRAQTERLARENAEAVNAE